VNQADPGWGEWDVAGDGYPEFNYDLNQNGKVVSYGDAAADYLVDVMSGLGNTFVKGIGSQPFVLELATFAPHAPYTPAPRYLGTFHETVPRIASFNTANVNPPAWLKSYMKLTPVQVKGLDTDFNLRVEAVQAVDDMITALMATLKTAGLDQSTYIFFSSDNGYHMGEHRLTAGKQTAFDSDIKVPLIVIGPGVPAGAVVDDLVENIDLCPTFAEIGGATAPPTVEGHSLAAFLTTGTVTDWRQAALVEHRGGTMDAKDPDLEPTGATDPTTYNAIRLANEVYVEYETGETEYYDIETDPYEMDNTVATLPAAKVASYHDTLTAIRNCHDASSCWAAQKIAP
jgi:N-acetylglucosamine-6-sulfatase